jgi:ATP-dependent DNA helicase RecQ
VIGSFDRPNLEWRVAEVRDFSDKMRCLRGALKVRAGATIVYAATRRSTEAVRRGLAGRGLPAVCYHAGMTPGDRADAQDRFLHEACPIVVATNAFGMGIDRPDVRSVYHFQLPGSLEAYYQEAGRAGRDGSPAKCTGLLGPGDFRLHQGFINRSFPEEDRLRRVHASLVAHLPPDTDVSVSLTDLKKYAGGSLPREDLLSAMEALARAGNLSLAQAEGRTDPGSELISPREGFGEAEHLTVTVRRGRPRLEHLAVLRKIEEGKLSAVQTYASARGCRKRVLLAYFGEDSPPGPCGSCDRCKSGSGSGWFPAIRRRQALFARRAKT